MNDFDEDYTYHGAPLPPKWTGGQVTMRRLGEAYPPPPYNPHAYPAGPDCRTADEKVQARLDAIEAQIGRLAEEVAALGRLAAAWSNAGTMVRIRETYEKILAEIAADGGDGGDDWVLRALKAAGKGGDDEDR